MTIEDIKEDPHVIDFLNTRSLRESTTKEYLLRINAYCNFLNKTPTKIIEEAEDEEDSNIRMKRRNIKRYLTDFLIFLKDNNKSENYISAMMSTVISFYREFDIETPKIKIKTNTNSKLITTKDIVTKEHILKLLEHCNLKYKAIILLMSSSGMGQSEILNLTYKDFINAISDYYKPTDNELFDVYHISQKLEENKDDLIGTWQIQRYKTSYGYVTFSSPESVQMILHYLTDRILQNRPVKSLDDWLFESKGKQISTSTLVSYFKGLNDRCEFGYVGKHRFFTSHKLRKYFASTLHKNKIPELTTHWLLGHRVDPVTEAYFKADITSLKEQYKTIVEDLSIENVILREVTTEGYDKLLAELRKEREIRELESAKKDKEMKRINKELELMKELMDNEDYKKDSAKE